MSVHFPNGASPIITQGSILQRTSNIAPPYPGTSAHFILKEAEWEPHFTNCNACRHFLFESTTEKSLIKHFYLFGCWDGTLRIAVHFDWQNYLPFFGDDPTKGSVAEFLKSHDLTPDGAARCVARTPVELTNLFQIILDNNTIPAENLDTIRSILKEGKCEPTPWYEPHQSPDYPTIGPFNC
jgi:hypothetical protein